MFVLVFCEHKWNVTVFVCCDGSRITLVVMAVAAEQAGGDDAGAQYRREQ